MTIADCADVPLWFEQDSLEHDDEAEAPEELGLRVQSSFRYPSKTEGWHNATPEHGSSTQWRAVCVHCGRCAGRPTRRMPRDIDCIRAVFVAMSFGQQTVQQVRWQRLGAVATCDTYRLCRCDDSRLQAA